MARKEEKIIAEMRSYYSEVYSWLQIFGINDVNRSKSQNSNWSCYDDEKFGVYQSEMRTIPSPEDASPKQMQKVANSVVMGIFERHFSQPIGDMVLGRMGRLIQELFDEWVGVQEQKKLLPDFFAIDNELPRNEKDYFIRAEEVYGEVYVDSQRNLGGRVALADTNWEMQKRFEGDRLLFRKERLLNLSELEKDEENLFQLAKDSMITITSIIIIK